MNSATLPSESELGHVTQLHEEWVREEVYAHGDAFLDRLESAINLAKSSIEFESYIFYNDTIGTRFARALAAAARRGVRVRVIVDGIGSWGWVRAFAPQLSEAGVAWKVYHQLPWERFFSRTARRRVTFANLVRLVRKINNRNHRKVCIVDRRTAFLGSRNITDVHSESVSGDKAWRDTSVIVEGAGVEDLLFAFERIWFGRRWRSRNPVTTRSMSPLVRLNITRRLRVRDYLDLRSRISRAKERVWITNAYFVPHKSLLRALLAAASKGADVRILLPEKSDVFFIPWVAAASQLGLLKAGARVFEYQPTVLHAKTLIVDDWALVGSSNLNHRSLMHDLEADVFLTHDASKEEMKKQFLRDLEVSREITLEEWGKRSKWERWLGQVLLRFRYWL